MSLLDNALVTSDLHLTDNPRDEYRWGIFLWLREIAKKKGVGALLILGDITDAKDRHSSVLVNRVVEELTSLTSAKIEVWVLRGNHDGIDPARPYFRFLQHVPDIHFVYEPTTVMDTLLLPHSRDPRTDWHELEFNHYRWLLAHATVTGVQAENGQQLAGVPRDLFSSARAVLSGDVHVPQTIGNITYVGAPYPIRFGDSFAPRVILFRNEEHVEDLHYPCLRRLMVNVTGTDLIADGEMRAGDQVKVRVHLSRAEALNWEKHRETVRWTVEESGAELHGIELIVDRQPERKANPTPVRGSASDSELLKEFCEREQLDTDTTEMGELLLERTGS